MLKCKKAQILRPIVPGSGEGGNQPTLFAPTITVSGNTVTWERDTRNGGFGDTLAANVEGQVVTSPLTITQQLDRKTLQVKSVALNFKDGIRERTLYYIGVTPVAKKMVMLVDRLRGYDVDTGNHGYIQIAITQTQAICDLVLNKGKFVFNGVDYPIEQLPNYLSTRSCAFHVPIVFRTGKQEVDFYLEIFEDIELPSDAGVTIRFSRLSNRTTPISADYGTAGSTDDRSIEGSVYGFFDNEPEGTSNTVYCTIPTENRILKKGIYTAYFDMRVA